MKARQLSLTAIIAALYAAGTIALAPISFALFQCRVADSLLALSTILGWPVIIGTTVGCAIANAYGGLGPVDVVGGSIANFAATAAGYYIYRLRFRGALITALLAEALVVSVIVGGYLAVLFQVPFEVGFIGVLLGSLVAIVGLGWLLIAIFAKRVQGLEAAGRSKGHN